MVAEAKMIDGVKIKKLKVVADERGRLMEILRNDDEIFQKFGQVYMTTANPGYVKGWHYHKEQTDNFTCIKGKIKLVLFDSRGDSKTKGEVQEFRISLEDPVVVQIPPLVFHGFEADSGEEAVVINNVTEPYNREQPDEFRVPFDSPDVPYKWDSKKGG